MTLTQCAIWGLFGGFAVEGLELAGAIRRTGRWPSRWHRPSSLFALLTATIIRLGVSAGLAAAVGGTGQTGPFSALSVGVAAPLIVEKLAQQVQLGAAADPQHSPQAPRRSDSSATSPAPDEAPGREPGVVDAS